MYGGWPGTPKPGETSSFSGNSQLLTWQALSLQPGESARTEGTYCPSNLGLVQAFSCGPPQGHGAPVAGTTVAAQPVCPPTPPPQKTNTAAESPRAEGPHWPGGHGDRPPPAVGGPGPGVASHEAHPTAGLPVLPTCFKGPKPHHCSHMSCVQPQTGHQNGGEGPEQMKHQRGGETVLMPHPCAPLNQARAPGEPPHWQRLPPPPHPPSSALLQRLGGRPATLSVREIKGSGGLEKQNLLRTVGRPGAGLGSDAGSTGPPSRGI